LFLFLLTSLQNSQARISFVQSGGGAVRNQGSKKVVEVAAGFTDKKIGDTFDAISLFRVWNLDFSRLKTPWDAFDGFTCKSKALQFEERASKLLHNWCCRFKEEAEKYNTTEKVKLHLIPTGREFSIRAKTDTC
jgi:hypothetical protein